MSAAATLLAAVLGALAAGGYDHCLRRKDRKEEHSAILNAICSEVSTICELVRRGDYIRKIDEILLMNLQNRVATLTVVHQFKVYLAQNYFNVFESLSPKLGYLSSVNVREIVRFYGMAKIAIDCLHKDAFDYAAHELEDAIENFELAKTALSAMLELGDQIVQFPQARH